MYNLNMKASVGFPLCRHYTTAGQFFGWDGMSLNPARLREMWDMVKRRMESEEWDPFRVFIKKEPHKAKKIEQGRWRLIFAGSLVDQIVDQLLFRRHNEKELENIWRIPTKAGWVPYFGGADLLLRTVNTPESLDKEANDWSMMGDVTEINCEHRIDMCVNPSERWESLVRSRYAYCFRNATVVLSDGTMLRQTIPGCMKSGLFNTISDNSRAQVTMHETAVIELSLTLETPNANGDDTFQEGPLPDVYVERLGQYGPVVKREESGYHFCGVDLQTCEPLYWDKHLMSILYAEELPSTLDSFQRLYANSKIKLGWIHGLMLRVCPERILSARYLTRWMKFGEE